LMQAVKPLEIDVALVDHEIGSGLDLECVEGMDLVELGVGNRDEHRDLHPQVPEGVQLDGGFASAESGPGKQLQTRIDGGRIERVNLGIERFELRVDGKFL